MALTSLCLMLSTLSIAPNRTQFFAYEKISLWCTVPANSSSWSVRRTALSPLSEVCSVQNVDSCNISDTYPSDSGVYWCESQQGVCSNKVNITVTAGPVILESPPICVSEGELVTLRCLHKSGNKTEPNSGFTATFFKNEVFIGRKPNGKIIFPAVSQSDEGYYRCTHPVKGTSPQSFLAVTARAQQTGNSSSTHHPPVMSLPRLLCTVFLLALYSALSIVCLYVYRWWSRGFAADRTDVKRKMKMNRKTVFPAASDDNFL